MTRLIPFAALLLLLTGCAVAPESGQLSAAPRTPLQEAEALPTTLGPLRRTGPALDFERQPGGAGLGAGARYAPASGERMAVTVYIYDRGLNLGREGVDSSAVAQELRNAMAELELSVRVGTYRSIKPGIGLGLGVGGGPPDVRCATFTLVQRDGAPTGDSICLTVQQGRFVKVRLTMWTPPDAAVAGMTAGAILSNLRGLRAGGEALAPGLRT